MIAPLDRFRAAVMADPALQYTLAAIATPAAFVAQALSLAADRSIPLTADMLAAAAQPDPLGIHRFSPAPLGGTAWPGRGWRPVGIGPADDPVWVDWVHFGDVPVGSRFYEAETRSALARPFNRLFRYRMTLAALIDGAPAVPAPAGLIFHLSRSGSTLTARILAALPDVGVAIEPPPLDTLVDLLIRRPGIVDPVAAFRAMVAALGDGAARQVVKLDSWHALALPLLRRAFPATPWLFLCRDPAAVLASQLQQRGRQTEPGVLPPALCENAALAPADYVARGLARIGGAIVDHWDLGGGLVVDYAELPNAVERRVLPHFGIASGPAMRAALVAVARHDAKVPDRVFASAAHPVDATIRAAAAGELTRRYLQLRALGA